MLLYILPEYGFQEPKHVAVNYLKGRLIKIVCRLCLLLLLLLLLFYLLDYNTTGMLYLKSDVTFRQQPNPSKVYIGYRN